MVNTKKKEIIEQQSDIEVKEVDLPDDEIKWCSVDLSEVLENDNRLEASVFKVEAKKARELVEQSKYNLKAINGKNGFLTAYHRPRFRRIFLEKSEYGIFQPSQITEIKPKPDSYISGLTDVDIEKLRVHKSQILLTCSGTIGNISYVSKTLNNQIFSHDLIRMTSHTETDSGYIYAFLKTNIGQLLIKTNNYGSVISHIEPKHLENILIPNPPEILKKEIHNLVVKSYNLRDESNDLIDEAEKMLIEELKLPPIEDFKPKYFDNGKSIRNFEVSLSKLNNRFDGSYHIPLVDCLLKHLKNNASEIKLLGDNTLSNRIILAGVFKRTYVGENEGVPFLGGKDIMQLSPNIEKFLSRKVHEKLIKKSLEVKENMILITDRGTIGNVMIVPKHFEGWAVSQNVIKLECASNDIAGYIYAFLNSHYGEIFLQRETYGSVINMIDDKNVAKLPIPLLKNKEIQTKINNLVLEANKKRYEAYVLEQKAIKMVNEKVIYAK